MARHSLAYTTAITTRRFLFMSATDNRSPSDAKRVLIAEDELLVAQTIRMVLAACGHVVEIADNGMVALVVFERGKYDLVITDFNMPQMNGLEFAKAIKQRSPSTPVILLTAHIEGACGSAGDAPSVDLVLGKPFSVGELQQAVRRVLG